MGQTAGGIDVLKRRQPPCGAELALRLVQETGHTECDSPLRGGLGDMVGRSAAMEEIFASIRQVAPSSAPVLICGKSGTGKELVAREIHKLSRYREGPFIAINSAALPESLIE